jgi:hypothetical protein
MLIAGWTMLAACQPEPDGNAVDDGAANETVLNLPAVVPLPEPPLDRSALLTAVARAASAAAAGRTDAQAQADLDSRPFELRIRFGCRGPAPELSEAVLGWTYDRQEGTLRVRAMPTISADGPVVRQVLAQANGASFEAVEGFWIPRPWLLQPVCPAAAAVRPAPQPRPEAGQESEQAQEPPAPVEDAQESQAPPPAWPKVGIASFFTEEDSRTRRRKMRAYETVKTLEPDQPIGSQGFDLVLSGRLRALPGRKVIVCIPSGPDNPPECVVSADIDRVWIERPDTKQMLAEWNS